MRADITNQEIASKNIGRKFEIEKILIQCIRNLSIKPDIDVVLNQFLQTIGKFYKADRAYIFEFDSIINSTYKWHSETTISQIEKCQNISIEIVD